MKILVINGPNMNLLGKREKNLYGTFSLKEIEEMISKESEKLSIKTEFFQSNYEGAIIEKIQRADGDFNGIILNPAGFAHTSVAIRDAIKAVDIPVVEVHITNIFSREEFRSRSITGAAARGVITGLGVHGYLIALHFFAMK